MRYPDLPRKLIVSSSIAKFRLDRALPMFEKLGGAEARAVAQRYLTDPNEEHLDEFMAACLPLYNTSPFDPDVIARVVRREEVGFHFFRGDAFTYDWFADLGRVKAPTLIPGRGARPDHHPGRPRRHGRRDPRAHGSRSSQTPVTESSGTSRRKHSRRSARSSSLSSQRAKSEERTLAQPRPLVVERVRWGKTPRQRSFASLRSRRVSCVETRNSRTARPRNAPPRRAGYHNPSGAKMPRASSGNPTNRIVNPKAPIEQSPRVRSFPASFGKSKSSRLTSGT